MERKLYGWGAFVGLVVSVLLAAEYETAEFADRGFTAMIMLMTAMCIAGYVLPMLRHRD